MRSDNIKFLRSKDFKFVKKPGSGGTGDTVNFWMKSQTMISL